VLFDLPDVVETAGGAIGGDLGALGRRG